MRRPLPRGARNPYTPGMTATDANTLDTPKTSKTADAAPPEDTRKVSLADKIGFTGMVLGMYAGLINVQIVGSSFKHIQGGLGADPDQVSWVLTAALIAEVIMIPLSGWLTRLMSSRWLFVVCITVFSLGSVGCLIAPDIETMIVFRAMQGLGGGAMMPMVFAAVFIVFPKRSQNLVMTIVSIAGTTAMAVGPTLGGFITETLGWRLIFAVNLPVAALVLVMVLPFAHFDKPDWNLRKNIDFLGIALAAACLACLLIVLEEGPSEDWFESDIIFGLAIVAGLSLYMFFWREMSAKHPVVDLRVFTNRNFLLGSIFITIFGSVIYVPLFMLPIYLAQVRDIDTLSIGLIMAVLGGSMAVSGLIAGVMLQYMRRRYVAALGFALLALGTYWQSTLTADYGFDELLAPQIIRGLASQLCWLASATMALGSIPPEGVRNASSLFNLVMRLGAAVMVAVVSTELWDRTKVYYHGIADAVPVGQFSAHSIMPYMTDLFHPLHGNSPEAGRAAINMMVLVAEREAFLMSVNHLTQFAAIMALVPLALMPFVRGKNTAGEKI